MEIAEKNPRPYSLALNDPSNTGSKACVSFGNWPGSGPFGPKDMFSHSLYTPGLEMILVPLSKSSEGMQH